MMLSWSPWILSKDTTFLRGRGDTWWVTLEYLYRYYTPERERVILCWSSWILKRYNIPERERMMLSWSPWILSKDITFLRGRG